MIDAVEFNQRVEELEQMLHEKIGVRAKSLSLCLKKAGRRLPKRFQKAGRVITGVQGIMYNPKLARVQDHAAIDAAFDEMSQHLEAIDPADRRKERALGLAGDVVFKMILLIIAMIVLLRWQGAI